MCERYRALSKAICIFFIYKLIWLQTLHEIKLVCFSPRDLELRTVCLLFIHFILFFFLLLVQHCELGQHFPGFTAIFFPVGVLLFSRSIFIPEQGSFQMQSIKETFIPWLLS